MSSDNLQMVTSKGARGETVLTLKGPLSINTVFKFQDAIRSDPSPVLIVDFTGVPFIDSAGLGALVGVSVTARKSGRKIAFAAMNEQARALIEMTHISQVFHTYDTIQDAEAAVVA
ncbi:MAG TPA: STAS domain-containing protein [Candidatus Acidoferrales bacterium]|nr:STAS domain-containing protein [Candidatus Acidoferrales bacterium]